MLLSVHGLEFLAPSMATTNHYRGLPGLYRRLVVAQIARQSLANASAVISNSGDYTPTMLAKWLNNKCVYRIGNPIAADFFDNRSEEVFPPQVRFVLWAGTIAERKNVIDLIEAFALVASPLPAVRLVMTGSVAETVYFERVRKTISARGLLDKVTIKGFIDQKALLSLFRQAALVVMASIEETAPMTIAQAMANGKPVVATRVGGIPWMVVDGVSGFLVDIGDIQGMADVMIQLLENDALRRSIGQAAYQRARQLFDPDVVAAQTVQAYHDLIGVNNVRR